MTRPLAPSPRVPVRLLLALLVVAGCAAPRPSADALPDSDVYSDDLVAVYDAWARGDDPAEAAPMAMVFAETVFIEAQAADGGGAALAERLVAVGMTGPSHYGPLVNGQLPIEAVPALAGVEGLRYVRPVLRPDRTPPRAPERI